jgi:hypothetical protein
LIARCPGYSIEAISSLLAAQQKEARPAPGSIMGTRLVIATHRDDHDPKAARNRTARERLKYSKANQPFGIVKTRSRLGFRRPPEKITSFLQGKLPMKMLGTDETSQEADDSYSYATAG